MSSSRESKPPAVSVELETARLWLRPYAAEDLAAMLGYQSQPAYLRFYPESHREEAVVRDLLARFLHWQEERPRRCWQFAVALRGDGRLIGSCGARTTNTPVCEAEFGCELDPAHWGKGYATEAGGAVVHFAFTQMRMHRLWAQCLAENTAIRRVLEKLGFRCEGWLRQHHWMKGRWWDSLIYAILAEEWEEQRTKETQTHG